MFDWICGIINVDWMCLGISNEIWYLLGYNYTCIDDQEHFFED